MRPFHRDPDFLLYLGDARKLAHELEPASLDCIVTSPPYFRQRDYQTGYWTGGDIACSHESARRKTRYDYTLANSPIQNGNRTGTDAQIARWLTTCPDCSAQRIDKQIGIEDDVRVYIGNLLQVFVALRHALKPTATLWINLGDSYGPDGLIGVPWLFAFAMKEAGFFLRAENIWAKLNVMPESVTNRPTKAHEQVFLFTLRRSGYFYNQDAVREPHKPDGRKVTTVAAGQGSIQHRDGERWPNGGRNLRSVWTMATEASAESHYAPFPLDLPRRCLQAGCPTGGTVLDPFLGTGTTAKVARDLGMRSIGFELSEPYAQLAIQRMGQLSLLSTLEV